MGWLKRLLQQRTEEIVFSREGHEDWRRTAGNLLTAQKAEQIAHEIADSQLPQEEKEAAFDTLRLAIDTSPNLSYTEVTRARSEALIASERAQAMQGNISWEEYTRYEQEERLSCDERVAQEKRLGL